MEHNEQVIFRVYQEKEKVWERELKRLKNVQESRLRTSAQKVLKLEQMLMMQTYQQQQEKKRLAGDAQRSSLQCERLLQEVAVLRDRLEETEWGLCEKTGEISLLKTQLKELQNDHLHKLQLRETKTLLEERDKQLEELRASSSSKDEQIHALREELARLTASEVPRPTEEDLEVEKLNLGDGEVERLRDVLAEKSRQFEGERLTWAQEKEKVLKYQRQLQLNYVQMFRRARELEVELQRKKEEEDSSH